MRLFLIFILLAAMVLITFFIWGDSFMKIFSQQGSVEWLVGQGWWAWGAGILLLMADLFLPLPATIIMSALGYVYGTVGGGLVGAAGSFLAGTLGYWLCRTIGENASLKILGEKDFKRGKVIVQREIGIWIVVFSRWLPVFPEVISCMAGLTRMDPLKFHIALLCGSLPMGFAYSYIGSTGVDNPGLALGLSAGVPPLIWLMIRTAFRKRLLTNLP